MEAVAEKREIKQADYSAKQIADYFVHLSSQKMIDEGVPEGITPLKLQKILYFSQAASLAIHNKKIFTEDIEAWKYGPVVPVVFYEYKSHLNSPLTEPIGLYKEITNPEAISILDGVWELFNKYSASELVDITHQHAPWKDLYQEGRNIVISPGTLKDYYNNIFELSQSE